MAGGARPGAGNPGINIDRVIRYDEVNGEQVGRSIADIVVETMAVGGFLHDAAAKVGYPVETLREWRKLGAHCLAAILAGTKRRSEMTAHQKRCMELVHRMDKAEAEARTSLLALARGVATGGLIRTETTVKTITPTVEGKAASEPVEVERVTRTIEAAPDGHMLGWLLSHRWPADFGRTRVEVTGEGGGPVRVDARPIIDVITQHLADIRTARDETDPARLDALVAGNGNGSHAEG